MSFLYSLSRSELTDTMLSTVTQWRVINVINHVSVTTPEVLSLNFMGISLFITKQILYSYLFSRLSSVTSIID